MRKIVISKARQDGLNFAQKLGVTGARICRVIEAITLTQANGDVDLAFGNLQWHNWRDALDSYVAGRAASTVTESLTHLILEQTKVLVHMERDLQRTENLGPVTDKPVRVPILVDSYSKGLKDEQDRLVRECIVPTIRGNTLFTPNASGEIEVENL